MLGGIVRPGQQKYEKLSLKDELESIPINDPSSTSPRPSRTRQLLSYTWHVFLVLLALLDLLSLLRTNIQAHTLRRLDAQSCNCGNSTTEARALGCQ